MKKKRERIGKKFADMLYKMGHKVSSSVRRKAGAKLRAEARGKFDREDGRS
jgi:hypothetical protein